MKSCSRQNFTDCDGAYITKRKKKIERDEDVEHATLRGTMGEFN